MKSAVKPRAGPDVVKRRQRPLPGQLDYDVMVCGGVLGLLVGLSLQARDAALGLTISEATMKLNPGLCLQLQGWQVCIVEKRLAEGRLQEWNSTREELQARHVSEAKFWNHAGACAAGLTVHGRSLLGR